MLCVGLCVVGLGVGCLGGWVLCIVHRGMRIVRRCKSFSCVFRFSLKFLNN